MNKNSTFCKYKKVLVDVERTPIKLPKLEELKKNHRFSELLKKIKEVNFALTQRKYSNFIILTPTLTRDNSCKDMNLDYTTWKGLAEENKEYKKMLKAIEGQNQRISRLKRIRHN